MEHLPIQSIDRHTFRKLAAMTSNRKLRLVYLKMMVRWYKKECA